MLAQQSWNNAIGFIWNIKFHLFCLQSRETWHDLRDLERDVKQRYLTHPAEEPYMLAKDVHEAAPTATISSGIMSGEPIARTLPDSSESASGRQLLMTVAVLSGCWRIVFSSAHQWVCSFLLWCHDHSTAWRAFYGQTCRSWRIGYCVWALAVLFNWANHPTHRHTKFHRRLCQCSLCCIFSTDLECWLQSNTLIKNMTICCDLNHVHSTDWC